MSDIPQRFLQVVHGLVAVDDAPGVELLALRDDAAYVQMEDGSVAIVINPSKRGEALEAVLHEQLSVDTRTHLKLVIIGGGPDMRDVLGRVRPGFLSRRMVQTYHLGADGTVWSGPGSRLDSPTGELLQSVADGKGAPEVSFAELGKRVPVVTAEDRAAVQQHVQFVQRFRSRRPRLTLGVVAGLAIVFGLEVLWGGADYIPTLVRMGANTDSALGPEPWRLLASVCLHGGAPHFIVNAAVLYILGGELERILGWARMAILLVVSGLAGAVASAAFSDAALSVGASGAIWGVLAALGVLAWRPGTLLPPAVVQHLRRAAVINLVINLGASFLPQVDFMAHFGGGLAGAALMFSGVLTRGLAPLDAQRKARPVDARPVRLGAIAGLVGLGGSVVLAVSIGRPWLMVATPQLAERTIAGYTVEAPQLLGAPQLLPSEGWAGGMLGDALRYPFSVIVQTQERDPVLDAAEVDAWPEVETPVPELGTQVGERRVIEDADVPTFEEEFAFPNGLTMRSRYSLFPRARVVTEVHIWEGTDPAWAAAAERTLGSIREAAP